jgi:hypothetical protein
MSLPFENLPPFDDKLKKPLDTTYFFFNLFFALPCGLLPFLLPSLKMMRFVALLAMCAAQAEAFSVPGVCAPSLVRVRPALQV